MKSFERRVQVARALKREIANEIQAGFVKDDRLPELISIIEVDLNPSLSSAKVLFSVMSEDDTEEIVRTASAKAALDEHASRLRGVVARKLNLKYAPKLNFCPSDSLRKSVDLVHLIDKAVEEDGPELEE